MYPTVVKDVDSLDACFGRMYKNYVNFCKNKDVLILEKDEWIRTMLQMDRDFLIRLIYSFNVREMAAINN